jgi:hypothetical protein
MRSPAVKMEGSGAPAVPPEQVTLISFSQITFATITILIFLVVKLTQR